MNEQLDLSKYEDKKLIAFDLYGTCIDHPNKIFRLSWNLRDILKTRPISLLNWDEIENNWEKIKVSEELIDMVRKDIEWTFIFPETLEVLKYIKSKWYKIALVSNLSKDYAEPIHKFFPEWIFDYEVLSFDVWAVKPDSKIYEYLRDVSKIDFKDMVFIWDTLKADVLWPKELWIEPIHVNRDETEPWAKLVHKRWIDFIQISTLADLKEIL